MTTQKSSTYDDYAVSDADSRAGDGLLVFPFFAVVSALVSVVSNIGWIVLGIIMTITGLIRMFTKMFLLTVGLYRLLRSPPSAGSILIGGTMIFAGSMGLFTSSVQTVSCLRKALRKKELPSPIGMLTAREMKLSTYTPPLLDPFQCAQEIEADYCKIVCPVYWELDG